MADTAECLDEEQVAAEIAAAISGCPHVECTIRKVDGGYRLSMAEIFVDEEPT